MNTGLQSVVLAAGSSQCGPCEERTEAAPIAVQLLQLQAAPALPKAQPPAALVFKKG